MPNTALPTRHRMLLMTLAGYASALICVVGAAWIAAPWRLVPLLLAQTLTLTTSAWALGCTKPTTRRGDLLRRGVAHVVFVALYAGCVWLLTTLPLASMALAPSLGASVLLSLALVLALALLWRWWPLFALLVIDDDAWQDATWRQGIQHCFDTSAHITREPQVLFKHGLPAGIGQLLLSFAALSLAGVSVALPPTWLPLALAIYASLLAVVSLLVVSACQRARADEAQAAMPEIEPDTSATPAALVLTLSPHETRPGARESALVEAARGGDSERALALLGAGADANAGPDLASQDQRSALVLSALLPDTRLLRALITRGADVQRRHGGLTPLLAATRDSYQGRPEAVMTLLANGADPRTADTDGNTPLHCAALSTNADIAAMLLDAQADIDAPNRSGHTPLAAACRAGNWTLAKFLLERGARCDPERGEPVLIAAADNPDDNPEGVRALLRRKAKVNARDSLGRSALMAAALANNEQIVAALLEVGAKVDLADQHGTTALMEAARAGADGIIALLATRHPDPHQRDVHGRNALSLACQSSLAGVGTVRTLLALGANPQDRGPDGRHAVDHAANAGRWNLVAILDPNTPLPASHCDDVRPEPGTDNPEHLLDALRCGHWAAVSGFRQCARQWPMATLADLYVELSDPTHANARRWLLDNGLDTEAPVTSGERLLDALYAHLPDASDGLQDLLHAAASPAGAGGLARAMGHLHATAEANTLVPMLLDGGADPFAADAAGMTPLHHAAAGGLHAIAQTLLARGCDPNVRDHDGQSPLHHALANQPASALTLVRMLLRHGADPEAAAANGETPLGLALAQGDDSLANWLRWSTWPLPQRALRANDLPAAAMAGDTPAVEKLLGLGFAVDTGDAQGATALLRACGRGHMGAAKALLDAGADPALAASGGATALSAAVSARHPDLVRLLLARGAAVDQTLRGGATALLVSAALGMADVAELLLDGGADIHAVDAGGRGTLHAAGQFCFTSTDSLAARRILDVLISHGAQPGKADHNGATALLFMLGAHAKPGTACDATHLGALLPVLLDAGADATRADQRGVSPLHACAMHALMAPARVLLAHGADREARDNRERRAADIARLLGYIDIARELGSRDIPSVQRTLRQPASDFD